jgi:transposase
MQIPVLTKQQAEELYKNDFSGFWLQYDKLQKEYKELNRRLNLNSSNSGKPSSTDSDKNKNDLKKKRKSNRNNSRKPTDKPIGGQVGHKGHTRKLTDSPTGIDICIPEPCSCGHQFNGSEKELNIERRQVIDIPKPIVNTVEYQAKTCECPNCGEANKGVFPSEVKAPVQYGKNICATVTYLMSYQLLPYKRTAEFFQNILGLSISQGTLRNINSSSAEIFQAPYEEIKQQLINSDIVHFDESGIRVEGDRDWLHVASTDSLTFYFHHEKRGADAMDEAGILTDFNGIACHDHWSSYYKYDCKHLLCNAHHLRDLEAIIENNDHNWAKDMQKFLREANHLVKQAKSEAKESFTQQELKKLTDRYQAIIISGYKEIPPLPERVPGQRGPLPKGKSRNLLERFDLKKAEIIGFIIDFSNPFDNNQAERDVRMVKVKQKISGSFRSGTMAKGFLIARSFISTATKQGRNVFDSLVDGLSGKFFIVGNPYD